MPVPKFTTWKPAAPASINLEMGNPFLESLGSYLNTPSSSAPSLNLPSLSLPGIGDDSPTADALGASFADTLAKYGGDSPARWLSKESFIGTKETPGWGNTALQGITAGLNAYLGMKQLKLAKDSLNENKHQFRTNFEAQRKTTNAALSDRQAARNAASAPGTYQDTASYMKQYGI